MKDSTPRRIYDRLIGSPNAFLLLTTAIVIGAMSLRNPSILSVAQFFDLARNSQTPALMALGVMLILIAGGLDVSFTAIAAFAMYSTVSIAVGADLPMGVIVLCAIAIGAGLGLVNGVLVAVLRLPALIVTLGTLSLFRGILLTWIGSTFIGDMPKSMDSFAAMLLFSITDHNGFNYSLPASFLFLVGAALILAFVLRWTIWGRNIYALGGSEVAAERIGISITSTKISVYVIAGGLAGLAGVLHAGQARLANPFDLVGTELSVIAAVVIGGARLTGGHGTVFGTLLGVFLVTFISTSLIAVGIPSYWQTAAMGVLILVGAAAPFLLKTRRG